MIADLATKYYVASRYLLVAACGDVRVALDVGRQVAPDGVSKEEFLCLDAPLRINVDVDALGLHPFQHRNEIVVDVSLEGSVLVAVLPHLSLEGLEGGDLQVVLHHVSDQGGRIVGVGLLGLVGCQVGSEGFRQGALLVGAQVLGNVYPSACSMT